MVSSTDRIVPVNIHNVKNIATNEIVAALIE